MVHPLLFTTDRSISKSVHAVYISTRRCVSHLPMNMVCVCCVLSWLGIKLFYPFPFKITSLAVRQPYDVPNVSEATLNTMSKASRMWNEEVSYKYIQYNIINPYVHFMRYAVYQSWKAPNDFSCFDLIVQKDFMIHWASLLVQFVIVLHSPAPELYGMINFKHPCPTIRYLYKANFLCVRIHMKLH